MRNVTKFYRIKIIKTISNHCSNLIKNPNKNPNCYSYIKQVALRKKKYIDSEKIK